MFFLVAKHCTMSDGTSLFLFTQNILHYRTSRNITNLIYIIPLNFRILYESEHNLIILLLYHSAYFTKSSQAFGGIP